MVTPILKRKGKKEEGIGPLGSSLLSAMLQAYFSLVADPKAEEGTCFFQPRIYMWTLRDDGTEEESSTRLLLARRKVKCVDGGERASDSC